MLEDPGELSSGSPSHAQESHMPSGLPRGAHPYEDQVQIRVIPERLHASLGQSRQGHRSLESQQTVPRATDTKMSGDDGSLAGTQGLYGGRLGASKLGPRTTTTTSYMAKRQHNQKMKSTTRIHAQHTQSLM